MIRSDNDEEINTSPVKIVYFKKALNQSENTYDFNVLNNLLPFKSQTADIIPWFGQTMWEIPIDITTDYPKTRNKLAEEGYIKITIKKSLSETYNNLASRVIQP